MYKFISILKKIIIVHGLILSMFLFSFILVSFINYSHQNPKIEYQNLTILDEDKFTYMQMFEEEKCLYISLETKEKEDEFYLMECGLICLRKYQKTIHIDVNNKGKILFIVVSLNNIISLS